eukprot:GHVH01001477.1.p1 GENE.GHVH01001477.1~~GHVH01001477.1.p1  ORF type:complete len:938 (-),score=119.84 GHVH01001477.1:70-2883(-)
MGVPTFFKWLCQKWPKVILECVEEKSDYDGSTTVFIPCNTVEANPSGIEFDNLYLDMNGIIHPCAHPESIAEQPETEEEMFLNVFTYVDRLFNCVRPRKLLYMAIDGVAPRAKMNQQRLRRFKAANESKVKRDKYDKLRNQFEAEGREVPPFSEKWDHNVITPGTPFMARLGDAIRFYIEERMANDPAWRNLTVIFSDASIPGEGEHKIMQYIRDQRSMEGYNWNMSHCVYGMDADLIMLGLATHEAQFYIIREMVQMEEGKEAKHCAICGASGHWASDCTGEQIDEVEKRMALAAEGMTAISQDKVEQEGTSEGSRKDRKETSRSSRAFRSSWPNLQFLSIAVLREYLAHEFVFSGLVLNNSQFVDLERCIDDFLLMCFFVGNDFLPHLPALSIHKGSIDQMLLLYQKTLPFLGDYLTDNGMINYPILVKFCQYLALAESEILQNEWKKCSIRNNREQKNNQRVNDIRARRKRDKGPEKEETEDDNEGKRKMTSEEKKDFFNLTLKQGSNTVPGADDPVNSRVVVLGSDPIQNYRPKYYRAKLKLPTCTPDSDGLDIEVESAAIACARAYTVGLSWVLQYYTQGTINWAWYYPYHYAPFTVDIVKFGLIGSSDEGCSYSIANDSYHPQEIVSLLKTTPSAPFKPFEQLLAVLPIASSHALPRPYQIMMAESTGPLADVYPYMFQEDSDGRKQAWQWIPLLPFIDPKRLVEMGALALAKCSEEDKQRNAAGDEVLYVYQEPSNAGIEIISPIPDAAYDRYATYPWPRRITSGSCAKKEILVAPPRKPHLSRLGPGTIKPEPVLKIEDLDPELTAGGDKKKNPNGFNANVARRIIMTTLCVKGLVPQSEVDKYEDPRFVQGRGGGANVSRYNNIRHQDYGNVALGQVKSPWQDNRNNFHNRSLDRPDQTQSRQPPPPPPDDNLTMMEDFAKLLQRDRM